MRAVPAGPPAFRWTVTLMVAVCGLALAACGSDGEPETPSACTAGADAYLEALESAPEEVRLDGETPIGDCLVEEQSAGDLADVGQATVEAATRLASEAVRSRDAQAALELGYLLGTVDAAAASTDGIHADLVRRLQVTARFGDGGTGSEAALRAAFERGLAAASRSQGTE